MDAMVKSHFGWHCQAASHALSRCFLRAMATASVRFVAPSFWNSADELPADGGVRFRVTTFDCWGNAGPSIT